MEYTLNTSQIILVSVMMLVALKAIIIGSDFGFYRWMKEGKKYTSEYFKRYKK